MAWISDKSVQSGAGIKPHKIDLVVTEYFKNPAVAQTTHTAAAILAATEMDSGTLYATLGDFAQDMTDVKRDLNLIVVGGTATDLSDGVFTFSYYDSGYRLRTKTITGMTMSGVTEGAGTGTNVYPLGAGVQQLVSVSGTVSGDDLTGVLVAVGYGAKLAVGNQCSPQSRIVNEHGITNSADVPTLDTDNGLFTPTTTLNGSTPVAVDIQYGSRRRR